jgi:3-methyladenine DNA glycosylase AlkD
MSPADYLQLVRTAFREHGHPEVAQGQMAYMRNQFEFYGLKAPTWLALTREIHRTAGVPEGEELKMLARQCLADDHRELHYFALETVQKNLKKQPPEFLEFLEELAITRSWWDTVDWLAKLIGGHLLRFPALQQPTTARWLASGNIWLQRLSMIFQLTYRDKTDAALLFHNIRQLAESKEFFIQKGAGWALRQYSKTDPAAVAWFVENNRLAPLTRREALKWVQKNQE